MDQASGAKIALRDILHEEGIGWYSDQHAVITPDVKDLAHAIGWFPSHWLAESDMTVEGLRHALDEIVSRAPEPGRGTRRARLPELRARLYGEFAALPQVDVLRGAVLEEQNRATAGQARYLEGLARAPRVVVLGGAGTGKSLALSEGAKQEADQGRSVLITFRSPGLTPFFESLIGERPIDVVPFADLLMDRSYDSVFVDEAQDLMTAADMDTLDTVVTGGRTSGRWRLFLDGNNQAHVDGDFDGDILELILDEAVEFFLPLNVRNTMPIVHVVQEYLGADVGDPAIVHGESLHWHHTDGRADLAEAQNVANELLDNGARPDSIWIIDASSLEEPVQLASGVVVTSPRFAKGLEADRVVVCGLPETFDDAGTAAFYVAITRARVALHIVVSVADKKRLQGLLKTNMETK